MKIVIPTYKRANKVWTLFALAPEIAKDVILAVRAEESEEYKKHNPENEQFVLPPECVDVGSTRQAIWERFGNERFAMLDDDILDISTRTYDPNAKPKMATTVITSKEEQDRMFAELDRLLDQDDIALASPTPNWIMPDVYYWPLKTCAHVSQFFAIDSPKLAGKGLRWDRLRTNSEDQDFVLQVLEQGLDAVHMLDYTFVARPMKSGGDKSGLAKLWPDYVVPSKRDPDGLVIKRAMLFKDSRRRRRMRR